MIQRIQTVFLFLVTVLMAVTAFSPLMQLTAADSNVLFDFNSLGIGMMFTVQYPTWGVVSIALITAILALVNIFLYKKRTTQIRIGNVTSVIILLFYVTVYVYFNSYSSKYGFNFEQVSYGLILPIIALIFNILAVSNIKKDDKKVKSLDRIR